MSMYCRYCGTTIMEDDIDYCPPCKPASKNFNNPVVLLCDDLICNHIKKGKCTVKRQLTDPILSMGYCILRREK